LPEPKEMEEETDTVLSYVNKRYRLKIFHKDSVTLESEFKFTALRENGRIIVLKVYHKFKLLTFIFLHNKSKEGETEDTLDQTDNIKGIYELLNIGRAVKEKERVIIMGDFNLNPWDRLLHHKTHLSTSFYKNKNSILQRFPEKCFYNPIIDLLTKSRTINLAGTHISTSNKWGVFDYVLYDTKDLELSFDIITEFKDGSKLLNTSEEIKKDFFNYDLDHLPIVTTITKLISEYENF
jgi:exonuclease III